MDTLGKSVVVVEPDAEPERRKLRTLEEKLAIVTETMRPGASVAAIARRHGVNANLLFGWRRLHRKGLLTEQRHGTSPPLLPVKISSPTVTPTCRATTQASAPSSSSRAGSGGHIGLQFPDGIVLRLHGAIEREALAAVLAVLRTR